jgi:teichuronic acid biosynthesis glycosyltransferase TuaG
MPSQISIILPNYNSSNTILATINSITSQSCKNWELIIIDDCSDVKTKKILFKLKKKKRIKIFYLKKNRGAAYCRNLGIKKANSNYLAFIDSDDLWHKKKLESQINYMEKNNYYFTYTNYRTFNVNKKEKKIIKPPNRFEFNSFVKNTSICTSTMIIKRSIINRIRFPNTEICEDYYFKCQILKKIKFAYCYPVCLTEYQIRKDSLQSNRMRNLYWIWTINKNFNQFSILENIVSIFLISFNSLKKYGFK